MPLKGRSTPPPPKAPPEKNPEPSGSKHKPGQQRRKFSNRQKLRILEEADAIPPGELLAYLKPKGLAHSHLRYWRQLREAGKLPEVKPKVYRKREPSTEVRPRDMAALCQEHLQVVAYLEQVQKSYRQSQSQESAKILSVIASLRKSWLAPGSYVLKLLEEKHITVEEMMLRPPDLVQKWFSELDGNEKARWIYQLRTVCSWSHLAELLQLGARRLQQLLLDGMVASRRKLTP